MANIFISPSGNDTTGDGSSGNPYLTIQKAHDVATGGVDTVRLLAGTYADTGSFTPTKVLDYVGDTDDPTDVIITDLQFNFSSSTSGSKVRAMHLKRSSSTILEGTGSGVVNFTAERCIFETTGTAGKPIGISGSASNSTVLTFSNCTFQGNGGTTGGTVGGRGTRIIKNCIFVDHGGIAVANTFATETVENCCFFNNGTDIEAGDTLLDNIFVDPDLQVNLVISVTSPCVDAGQTITGVTEGFTGTAPDIGSNEVAVNLPPTAPTNLAVVETP